MANVIDLDTQVNIANPETGAPSINFESRWHDLVLKIQDLETTLADYETRIDALENP